MESKVDVFEIDEISVSESDEEYEQIDYSIRGSLLNEAKDVIVQFEDINPYNAFQINQRYIKYLTALREKVIRMIDLCGERYDELDKIINDRNNVPEKKKKNSKWQGARAFGYPFFKNQFGKRAPENEDQKAMTARGELIPRDFVYMKKKNWTMMDQKNLLDGVKESMKLFHKRRIQQAIRVLQKRRQQQGRLAKLDTLLKELNRIDEMSFMSLWKCVKGCEDFKVDWDLVSETKVNDRHLPGECEAMWKLHLMPELKKTLWSLEEEDEMLNAVQELGEHSWEEVAERLKDRSAFQCFVQYQANFGISARLDFKKKFTPEEDERILELVEKYRFGNSICWTRLGSEFENRSKHSIYKRYHYTLKQNITRGRFSTEEDCILMASIEQYGTNFSRIVREVMPNRTVPQLRNRYENSLKFVGNNNKWTTQEDELLMQLADDDNKTWSEIAKILKTHNRISCRTRYVTITKFLEANPKKKVSDVPRKHRRLTTEVTLSNWKQKIMELQSEPESKKEKDPLEKTSQIDQRYFSYFLPAFNFKLGDNLQPFRAITNNLFHMSKILNLQITRDQLDFFKQNFTDNQFLHLKAICNQNRPSSSAFWNKMCLPVSWNTIVALRGVAATLAVSKPSTSFTMVSTNYPEVEEFKRRFRKIFYWTALLSRIDYVEEILGEEDHQEGPSCSAGTSAQEVQDQSDELILEFVIESSGNSFVVKAAPPKEDQGTKRIAEVEEEPINVKKIKEFREIE